MIGAIRRSLVGFKLSLIFVGCAGCLQAEPNNAIDDAKGYIISAKCDMAWETLWPLASHGNAEASAVILSALYVTLTPPMKVATDDGFRRANAFFAVSSIPYTSGDADFSEYRSVMLDYVWPLNDPDRLTCVSKNPPAKCMELAFERGFAPSAQSYASDVNDAEIAGISAYCREDQY